MQESYPFVPAKDPAQSEAHLKEFPGQYLPEVCFLHLPEKFIMMAKIKYSSEEKENPQLSNYWLQQYFLRGKVKRTKSQEISRISGDLIGNALQTATFVSNFEDLDGLIQQDGKVENLTLKSLPTTE